MWEIVFLYRAIYQTQHKRQYLLNQKILSLTGPQPYPKNRHGRAASYTLGLATSEGLVRTDTLNIYNIDPTVLDAIAQNAQAVGAHVKKRYDATHRICGYNIQPNEFACIVCCIGSRWTIGGQARSAAAFYVNKRTNRHIFTSIF